MRFPPDLLDEIRARLPVSAVVGRKVALKRKGREMAGLSPFKVEKTPSFFVNDQKGFYHCFATGEHGDIFTFLIKTEGLSFPEAVERLAAEAGVAMPKQTVQSQEREGERDRLVRVMAAAQAFFRQQLNGAAGREAREYLHRRGLRQDTLERFGIGYAPQGRSLLKEALTAQGFSVADQALSGMLISGSDIPVPYDRFRHRVMFPIADLKGRIIAFGGRALDPGQPAKYLNSPETPLFHKGHVLFNASVARETAYANGEIVVVEGYMDVVALAEAGFSNVVAPLGTALTEDQLALLWRFAPEPTLCFDGDGAGRKAAMRAVETALPHLKAGKSLKFAFLPDGLDPDDLVRQQGPGAMRAVLDRTLPLVDMLWDKEWAGGDWSTPERRAGLEQSLNTLVARIADPIVRAQYTQDMRQRLFRSWREPNQRGGGIGGQRRQAAPKGRGSGLPGAGRAWGGDAIRPVASSSLRQSALVGGNQIAPPYREALILRTLLNHPWLIDDHAEEIATLMFSSPALSRLRDGILNLLATQIPLDTASMRSQLNELRLDSAVDLVERVMTHKSDRFAEPDADSGEVLTGWRHTLALHEQQRLRDELANAERDFVATGSEQAQARIFEISTQLVRTELRDDI